MKKTIEDALNLIKENAAIIQSSMYDPQLSQASQDGAGRLAFEIQTLSEQIRGTLETPVLISALIDTLSSS